MTQFVVGGSPVPPDFSVAPQEQCETDLRKVALSGGRVWNPVSSVDEASAQRADKALLESTREEVIQELCQKALALKDAQSMVAIGERYEKGIDVGRDEELAVRWYQRAVLEGDSQAKMSLVRMNTQRWVDRKAGIFSLDEHRRLTAEAAADGNVEAMYSMSGFYVPNACADGSIAGSGPDYFHWLRLAADAGHMPAKVHLLYCHSEYAWVENQRRMGSDAGETIPELSLARAEGTCLGKKIRDNVPFDTQCEEEAVRLMYDVCLDRVLLDGECLQKADLDVELVQSVSTRCLERLNHLNPQWPIGESKRLSLEGILAMESLEQKAALRALAVDVLADEREMIKTIFLRDDRDAPEVMFLLARWMQLRREESEDGEECFKRAYPFFVAAANKGHPTAIRWLKSWGFEGIVTALEREWKMMDDPCLVGIQDWIALYTKRLGTFLDKNSEFREQLAGERELLEALPELKAFLPVQ